MKIHLSIKQHELYEKHILRHEGTEPLSSLDEQIIKEIDNEEFETIKSRLNKVIKEIQNKIEKRQKKNSELGYSHSRLPDHHRYIVELGLFQNILRKLLLANA